MIGARNLLVRYAWIHAILTFLDDFEKLDILKTKVFVSRGFRNHECYDAALERSPVGPYFLHPFFTRLNETLNMTSSHCPS